MPDSWAKALRPDDGLVVLDRVAGEAADQPRRAPELLGADAGGQRGPAVELAEVVGAGAQRHHDLLQRGVAGPLADAVDRALDLAGAVA